MRNAQAILTPLYSCLDPTLARVTKTIRMIHQPGESFLYNYYYVDVAERRFETVDILPTKKKITEGVPKRTLKKYKCNGCKTNVSLKSLWQFKEQKKKRQSKYNNSLWVWYTYNIIVFKHYRNIEEGLGINCLHSQCP
jgi:hypothetical protein